MKANKCKICGTEHWGPICPTNLGGGGESRPAPTQRSQDRRKAGALDSVERLKGKALEAPKEQVIVAHDPPKVKNTRASNGTFDRKSYQRDLMRKRRAALKAKT